ncbi:VanZ family protein [Neobacillus drentensis]|uniref:VanZ family protein n=1 Tax=Neobacillus drentensis TaxID=220684 RepID=UPI0030001F75
MFAKVVKGRQLKVIPVIIWGFIILLHTWTSNLGALLRNQTFSFTWIVSPDYLSFFYLQDISTIHHYFIIVKTGHFVGFAIFDYLLFKWLNNHKRSLVISISFALITEILQLYFGRDGRMYDLVIDTLGILTVYFLLKVHLFTKQSHLTKSN